MAYLEKALATKPIKLSLVSQTHTMKGQYWLPEIVLWTL